MDVEKRLLELAESLAEEVSGDDSDRFAARVFAAIGIPDPGVPPQNLGGAGRCRGRLHPGALREGEVAVPAGRGEAGIE